MKFHSPLANCMRCHQRFLEETKETICVDCIDKERQFTERHRPHDERDLAEAERKRCLAERLAEQKRQHDERERQIVERERQIDERLAEQKRQHDEKELAEAERKRQLDERERQIVERELAEAERKRQLDEANCAGKGAKTMDELRVLEQISYQKRQMENAIDDCHYFERDYEEKVSGLALYPNQEDVAGEIVDAFADEKINIVSVVALTQVGKTGAAYGVVKKLVCSGQIHRTNVFILTGLSSKDWCNQTKRRFPDFCKVYHLPDLVETESIRRKHSFFNDVKDKRDILIIIDEVHIASRKDQQMSRAFEKLYGKDLKAGIIEKNVKIVQFSATPDGVIIDANVHWGEMHTTVLFYPPDNYVGIAQLKQQRRILQTFSYHHPPHVDEVMERIFTFPTPRYHIFRINPMKEKHETHYEKNIVEKACLKWGYDCKLCVCDESLSDISTTELNRELEQQPRVHTIIMVKGILRCSKTLEKRYLGVLHDRDSNFDSICIQGLLGRNTGYDTNDDSIVYTNLNSVDAYLDSYDQQFKFHSSSNYTAPTLTTIDGVKVSVGTIYSDETLYRPKTNVACHLEVFNVYEDMMAFFKATLKIGNQRGPHRKHVKQDGPFKGFYTNVIRSQEYVHTLDDILQNHRKTGLTSKGDNYRYYVCYDEQGGLKHVLTYKGRN